MENKKILILGASGLLGHEISHFFKNKKCNVILSSRSINPNVCFTNDVEFTNFLNEIDPDVIINLIGLVNVDKCEENPEEAYLLNSHVAKLINRWLTTKSAAWLIHFSSDMVYNLEGYNKEDQVYPINVYGFTKLLGDEFAKGHQSIVLRTNFFGKSRSPNRESLSDWIEDSLKRKHKINLINDVYFNPLLMSTICDYLEIVIRNPISGIYNLASRDGMAKAEFAIELAKVLNLEVGLNVERLNLKEMGLKANRPKNMLMNVSLFERTYNLRMPSLIEEIRKLKNQENLDEKN